MNKNANFALLSFQDLVDRSTELNVRAQELYERARLLTERSLQIRASARNARKTSAAVVRARSQMARPKTKE